MYGSYYRHVVKAEKTGERDIKFTFDAPGQSRAAADRRRSCTCCRSTGGKAPTAQGRKRDISATTLEPPLGSGPYRIKEFVAGRSVTLERVKDYWGARSPTSVSGTNNFDELRFEYLPRQSRSRSRPSRATRSIGAPRTAPRTGRRPTTSRRSPTSACCSRKIPRSAVRAGCRRSPSIIRRDQFKDARVRRALNFAFDFEEMNKQLFFGQYKRISSYFEGTELASSGLAGRAGSWKSSRRVRDEVPAEVFTTALHQSGRRQSRKRCATICARRCGC